MMTTLAIVAGLILLGAAGGLLLALLEPLHERPGRPPKRMIAAGHRPSGRDRQIAGVERLLAERRVRQTVAAADTLARRYVTTTQDSGRRYE